MKKFTILLILAFTSIVIYAFSTGVTGTTQLNGNGCECHSLDSDPDVNVNIVGPSVVSPGETVTYQMTMTGGPAVDGGLNVAAFNGALSPFDAETQIIDGEITHTSPKGFTMNYVEWSFNYTAPSTTGTDTLYATGNSTNDDGIPSTLDKWNWSPKFIVTVSPIPVELISFEANASDNEVNLIWETATETNNKGFEIERSTVNSEWSKAGFVDGNGTTTEKSTYSFVDKPETNGHYSYRLKQVDFDGSFEYSDIVEVEYSTLPSEFVLNQNYPNPFNPATTISYSIPFESNVTITVYNMLGEVEEVLINSTQQAGNHQVNWNAENYASGVYIYSLNASGSNGNFSSVKKMILTK